MKTIINYFRKMRERRLRRWCVKQVFGEKGRIAPYDLYCTWIYNWVLEGDKSIKEEDKWVKIDEVQWRRKGDARN